MTELGLVGPGVLGRTLALSLPVDTYSLGGVLSHSKVSSRRAVREMKRGVAVTTWAELDHAKTILVAVPQAQLAGVLADASQASCTLENKRFLLTGVATRSVWREIERLESRGAQVGGLLPIALYRRPSFVVPETVFAVWGSQPALRTARGIVKALGGKHSLIDVAAGAQALLAVAVVSGALTTSFELAVRRLIAAGFTRHRAIEALAPLSDGCVLEHQRSRLHPPPHRFPASCHSLLDACGAAPAEQAAQCQAALRLAFEEVA